MIYKLFVSVYDTKKKLIKAKPSINILDLKYYTDFKEIEAASKQEAVKKFLDMHENLISELAGKTYYFYFLDNKNNII